MPFTITSEHECRLIDQRPVSCDAALTCGADGEDHLYRVEEKEHDQQGDGGSDGQEEGLRGVYGLNTCRRVRGQRGIASRARAAAPETLTVVRVAVVERPRCRGVPVFILLLVLTVHV